MAQRVRERLTNRHEQPVRFPDGDTWTDLASRGQCPNSPDPHQRHVGRITARVKVSGMVSGFRGRPTPVYHYEDTCRCETCGYVCTSLAASPDRTLA